MGKHLKQTDIGQLRKEDDTQTSELADAYEAIALLHEELALVRTEMATLKGGGQ